MQQIYNCNELVEDIYQKGIRLLLDKQVKLDVAKRAWYYKVTGDNENHDVMLKSDNTFNCTCMWGSLQGTTEGALCSHVIACVVDRAVRAHKQKD